VQAFPSLQLVPSNLLAKLQVPSPLQVPACWHWPGLAQVKAVPLHTPALHASPLVQARPSLQRVPSVLLGLPHRPVLDEQVPTAWHWSLAAQTTGLPPTQRPAWQVSLRVQAFPSSQAAPSVLAGLEHVPVDGLQVPGL
jgi:hypothetical protein